MKNDIGATSKYNIGDTIRFIKKNEYYTSTRVGSKGVILKSSYSMGKVCYWIKFKSHENWMYEDQIELWNKPKE